MKKVTFKQSVRNAGYSVKKPNTYYSTDQNIRFEMKTAEEETALWVKARSGDEAAREFLITNHLLFAHMEAQRLSRGLLPKDEVTSAANFAVMKAFESFDHARGFKFNTYLRPFIKGEIAALWKSKYVNGIPDPSLAGTAGHTFESSDTGARRMASDAEGYWGGSEAGSQFDHRGNLEQSEEHAGERLDLEAFNREKVASALSKLEAADAALIAQIYVEGLSFADVARAAVPEVSRQAIEQRHSRIILKLKKLLKADGVTRTQ